MQARVRSAGITAAATLAVLESTTILFVWLFFMVALVNMPPDARGKHLYQVLPFTFLLLALVPPMISAVGIRTGIGLFQLRSWARKAAILWAIIALSFCSAIIALRPFETFIFPDHLVSDVEYLRQLLVLSVLVFLLPISVWWLFYFRRTSVKSQFNHSQASE